MHCWLYSFKNKLTPVNSDHIFADCKDSNVELILNGFQLTIESNDLSCGLL